MTRAQPLGATHTTIEAQIVSADHVVLATISDLSRRVLVPQGGKDEYGSTDPNGKTNYMIKLKVNEIIKGDAGPVINDLQPQQTLGFDERYKKWFAEKTVFLCYLGPDPKPGEFRIWSFQPLGEPIKTEINFGEGRIAPMFAQDLSILKTEAEVIARAREFGPSSKEERPPGAPATTTIRLPNQAMGGMRGANWNDVVLPVNSSLEQLAHRLINSPLDLVPDDTRSRAHARYQLRMGGVQCLRFFKSAANVSRLQKLLDDVPEEFESDSNFKPLRVEVLETLLGWGIEVPLPHFWKDITVLRLFGVEINDESLMMVGKLKNLITLDLRETKITRDGLIQLNGLKKITTLSLSEDVLTDSTIQILNEMGLLNALSIAMARGDERRPKSPAEVTSLTLWNSPISSAALKEFSEFTNVVYLDLRNTRVSDEGLKNLSQMKRIEYLHLDGSLITDAGLKHLRQFSKLSKLGLGDLPITDAGLQELDGQSSLTYLRLEGTKVSPAGIAGIRKALPDCKVYSPFDVKR